MSRATPLPGPAVAFAGEHGAFAEDAALAAFPGAIPLPVTDFAEVFQRVTEGGGGDPGGVPAADRHLPPVVAGVVPIENVVNGTVREVYDLLLEHDLVIAAEVVVPVRLCLAALPGERLETIERVYSHIQALGQAEPFLRSRQWTLLTTYNTAGSGKLIAERHERGAAAVLSPRAAQLFGLDVLASDIQAIVDNRTRFLVIAQPASAAQASPPVAASAIRTTLVLAVRNEPGSLVRCLAVFAEAGINMSKLESRPSRERAWEYVFWIDLDADSADPLTAAALARLDGLAGMVRVLGSYPRATGG
ncbi:MAG: prephenate dehydratase [Candidatus Limnocylindrales bacterium]